MRQLRPLEALDRTPRHFVPRHKVPLGTAVGAGAAEHDLVLLHRVAEAPGGARERPLEPVVDEGLDPAAAVADEMVMVMLAARRLEPRDPVADVDALDEPQCRQRLERAVDARDADGAAGGADPVVDLLRRQAAALLVEELHHGAPGAAPAQPGRAEAGKRMVGPAGHRSDDTDYQMSATLASRAFENRSLLHDRGRGACSRVRRLRQCR